MATKPEQTIDDYINGFPEAVQAILRTMRDTIREALPARATEAVRYTNLATFKLDGEDFIYFAGWKNHVSLYPITDEVRSAFPELAAYKSSGETVQFPHSKPLPTELIANIVRWHLQHPALHGA